MTNDYGINLMLSVVLKMLYSVFNIHEPRLIIGNLRLPTDYGVVLYHLWDRHPVSHLVLVLYTVVVSL